MFNHSFNYGKNGKIADFNILMQNGYFYLKGSNEKIAILNRYHDFMICVNEVGRYFNVNHIVYNNEQGIVSFNAVKLS